MSGANVPYQLRPNKFVERQLFAELLTGLDRLRPVCDYFYVSMGGRLLEDFKLVHSRFGIRNMMSIEMDKVAYDRQEFNKPLGEITCLNIPSGDLVNNLDRHAAGYIDLNAIVWLDYAKANDRGQQLSEFSTLLSKLKPYDVAKITLNANPATLVCKMKNKSHIESQKEGFEALIRQLGDFKPDGPADHTVLVAKNFSPFLARAVQKAALEGVQSDRGLLVEPLSAFVYNDASHDMLTVTCIILEKRIESAGTIEVKDGQEAKLETETPLDIFLDKSRLGSWSFLARAWDDVHRIAIPDLSIKERAAIHEKLNAPSTDIQSAHAGLRFRLGEDEKESLKELEVYASHYRYYPSFLPVNV